MKEKNICNQEFNIHLNAHVSTLSKINQKTASCLLCGMLTIGKGNKRKQELVVALPNHTAGFVKFEIAYPNRNPYIGIATEHPKSTNLHCLTIGDICWHIAQAYKKIYKTAWRLRQWQYDKLSKSQQKRYDNHPNPYGIWGHVIDDLWIESLVWNPVRRLIEVGIGS